MSKTYDAITPALEEWIEAQPLFFVSTAPMARDGLINCSPKGLDTFRILGPHEVAYLDLTGSGVETIAHVRENGRIVFMFCAFSGPPNIVRLHGAAEVLLPDTPAFDALNSRFPDLPGTRAIIAIDAAFPSLTTEDRDTLLRWAEAKRPDGIAAYQAEKNTESLDGLPGLDRTD